MKNILLLFGTFLIILYAKAQDKKGTCCLQKNDLVGVWQRDSKEVGNGLQQHFQFFKDGSFELRLNNNNEDVRGIVALKESDPRKIPDPVYIVIHDAGHIELGTETYFKVHP